MSHHGDHNVYCDHTPRGGERSDPGAGSNIDASGGGPRGHDGDYVPKTPSRAALMERNQTLVREVRFADQTCVALAERKKFYKNQVGQYANSLRTANDEISMLRTNYESSIQESAQLKVLVESLRAQKHQADAQVESYRIHIADCEKSHRSSLKKIEKTYHSHLKNAEGQINGLNDRLHESLAANVALQSKFDDLHEKWESKLQSDAASKDLISSLKERVASGNSTAVNAHASMEAMQDRISNLQQLCDQQECQLQMERSEREMTEQDRDDLQAQCDDLHRQLTEWAQTTDALQDVFFDEDGSQNVDFALREYTPVEQPRVDNDSDEGDGPRTPDRRTPTANLLARTLRSELKRRQTVSERLEDAERQVAGLKNVVCDMKMECEEAKADNVLLVEELEERDALIAQLELTVGARDDQIENLCEEVEFLRLENDGASSSFAEERSLSRSQVGSGIESRSQRTVEDESRSYDAASVLKKRLNAMEETINFTDEELKETKARLADTQELLDQTAGELERSEEELAEAFDRASDYEAQVDKLFRDLTEKEVEHANLERFCHFQKSTIETINNKLSKSEKVNVEVRAQLESCFQSLVALDKILRTYEKFDGLEGKKLAEHRHKITHLLETIARVLETMKQFSPQAGGTLTTPRDGESRAFFKPDLDSPAMLSDFHHEQETKKELDNANVKLHEAQKLLREYRDEFSEKEIERNNEISSLKEQKEQIKTKLDEANKERHNTHKLLQQYQDESSKHDAELNDVNGHLQQANKLLEEYQDELRNQESAHKQETISLKMQCDELEARLSSVTSDLKNCKKENKSLSTTAAAAENAVTQQLAVMRSNNTDLMKENESLRISLQSFELQLENEISLLRATREEADGYRQDVSNAKAAFECMSTECDLTKNTLSKVEREAHALRELVNERERELKDCRESLSNVQDTLNEQVGSLKSKCLDLEKRLSVEESGRISAEATLDDAHVHIAMMENIIKEKETALLEKESECHQLIIQIKEVQNALVEAERERAEADIALERLENDVQEKKSVVFAYEESIISYKGDIRRLENELQTTILEKDSRIRMLEQACSSRQILFSEQLDRTKKERDLSTAELTDMINRLQNELLESNRQYNESGERAKSTFIDLNKAHQVLEQEVVQKKAYIDELTQNYNNSCAELDKAKKENDRMTNRMNSLEMDCTRLATRHQDEVEELLEQMNRMHHEKVQLEEQM
jgi:chromosome segregation ATPase